MTEKTRQRLRTALALVLEPVYGTEWSGQREDYFQEVEPVQEAYRERVLAAVECALENKSLPVG